MKTKVFWAQLGLTSPLLPVTHAIFEQLSSRSLCKPPISEVLDADRTPQVLHDCFDRPAYCGTPADTVTRRMLEYPMLFFSLFQEAVRLLLKATTVF